MRTSFDFSRIADQLDYCALHAAECLDEKQQAFIAEMVSYRAAQGEAFYVTAKQWKYVAFCRRLIEKKYPIKTGALSGLQRMKEAREKLRRNLKTCGKRNVKRKAHPLANTGTVKTLSISKAVDALDVEFTAKARRGRTMYQRTAEFIGTARMQKDRS